jgi:WD40 repeat protein
MKFNGMRNQPSMVYLGIVMVLLMVSCELVMANVTFATSTATMLLGAQHSKLKISNPAKVRGWGERSIVKSYGRNVANVWPEAYQADAVIGQNGQAGVTAPAYTNLIDANSNAIMTMSAFGSGASLIPTNYTTMLYLHRVNSNAIIKLSQGGSNELLSRTTSAAINRMYLVPLADSVDGTQFAKYVMHHHVFYDGAWSVKGWVRFNNGFTVMPRASVIMDTLTTVSGAIDLRDTGTLILNNDLYLAHNVTLANGGNIKGKSSTTGQANTIFMGGDLTLAETAYARTLHIMGGWANSGMSCDLIIDGCGHTLTIGDRAQIFVDTNVTLTLRNMTIKTGPKSAHTPAIKLAAMGSKLALDNVIFDVGADFQFKQGQLFVHNEVAVTGTSAFVYQSVCPSFITAGATWSFEQGMTLSVAPVSYTDQPFTAGSATSNKFIVLADATSALSLNGCSFKTTYTGLRLTKGMVLFDNKVAIDTTAGVVLDNSTPVTQVGSGVNVGDTLRSVAWSPDGGYVAFVCPDLGWLRIYSFDGASLPVAVGQGASTGEGSYPIAVTWSPDGRYLAVACMSTNCIRIYKFNGSSVLEEIGSKITVDGPYAVAWSPDGRHLAVASYYLGYLRVYRFNGSSASVEVGSGTVCLYPYSITWSPNGRCLSVACADNHLRAYTFNGISAPVEIGGGLAVNDGLSYLSGSPDGRYLALTCAYNHLLRLYRFNGSSVPVAIGNVAANNYPFSVTWSPEGRYLAVACPNSSLLRLYRFDGSSAPIQIGSGVSCPGIFSVAWSPDGRFVAAACSGSHYLRIFRCNYIDSGQPTQGFSNGLSFGDKVKGAAYDVDVRVLGNATVTVKGVVSDDSA